MKTNIIKCLRARLEPDSKLRSVVGNAVWPPFGAKRRYGVTSKLSGAQTEPPFQNSVLSSKRSFANGGPSSV